MDRKILEDYFKKIEKIDGDYVDRLEALIKNFKGAGYKEAKFMMEQLEQYLPYLKVYQSHYLKYLDQRSMAAALLEDRRQSQCKKCGCSHCICYLNEPG